MKSVLISAVAALSLFAVGCGGGNNTSSSGSSGTTATTSGTTTGGATTGGTSAGTTTTGGSNGGDPTIIITNLTDPQDLALDGSNLYWSNGGAAGSIQKAPLAGGTPTAIVPTVANPHAIAVEGSSIYWLAGDSGSATLSKANLDGSGVTVLAQGQDPDQDTRLFVINGNAYWGDTDGVHMVPVAGGNVTTVVTVTAGGPLLAADSSGLYYRSIDLSGGGWNINHANLDGTNAALVFNGGTSFQGLALAGSTLYWVSQDSSTSTINSTPAAGGSTTPVATYSDDAQDIAADGSGIYFSDRSGGDNGVYKVSGGSTTLVQGDTAISTESGNERLLRLDGSNLYWVGGGFNASQAVLHKTAR